VLTAHQLLTRAVCRGCQPPELFQQHIVAPNIPAPLSMRLPHEAGTLKPEQTVLVTATISKRYDEDVTQRSPRHDQASPGGRWRPEEKGSGGGAMKCRGLDIDRHPVLGLLRATSAGFSSTPARKNQLPRRVR
jgi:hypothetical protein